MDGRSWRKSGYSAAGNCAEVAPCRRGVLVRDSKDPGGPVLEFGGEAWKAFTGRVKAAQAA